MSERGSSLELQIDRWIKVLMDRGIYGQKNHAKRLQDGTYTQGENFDYILISNGKTYCFDAKESRVERWSLSNAKIHQVKYLKIAQDNGADAFFLVYYFPSNLLIKFPVTTIIDALSNKKKSLTAAEGIKFIYEQLML